MVGFLTVFLALALASGRLPVGILNKPVISEVVDMSVKKAPAANGDVLLSELSPSVNPRYSPNLYRWLNNKQSLFHQLQIYTDRDGVLYIGWLDDEAADVWFTGARLMAVLCYGTKERMWAHTPMQVRKMGLTVLPDFWTKYREVGRCVIDPHHSMWFIDEATSRWDPAHPGVCQWCGQPVSIKQAG